MKKFPRIVQCDKRGQVVIPKDIRQDLGIEEGTGFYAYSISEEGIFLKKVPLETLEENSKLTDEISEKAEKIGVNKKNIEKSKENYRKTKEGNLDII